MLIVWYLEKIVSYHHFVFLILDVNSWSELCLICIVYRVHHKAELYHKVDTKIVIQIPRLRKVKNIHEF